MSEAVGLLDDIWERLLPDDRARFRTVLAEALEPQREYLTDTEYHLYERGKKLRPMMLLLSARMSQNSAAPVPDKVIQGAVSLEMLHVATLIHDDIVDEAQVRRGLESVNANRGSSTALIVGDLQFVAAIRGFVGAIDTQEDMGLVKLVLDTAFRICCGELDELRRPTDWDTGALHARYMKTIERKTAVMFGMACESGVSLGGGRSSDARRAGFYGRRVGRAFQMMDDLFDFVHDDDTAGKAKGVDLSLRRLSLPIVYAMDELGPDHLVSRIMRGAEFDADDLSSGVAAVRASRGFARAYADARAQALDALQYLALFPPGKYRSALEDIALYVVDRGF